MIERTVPQWFDKIQSEKGLNEKDATLLIRELEYLHERLLELEGESK